MSQADIVRAALEAGASKVTVKPDGSIEIEKPAITVSKVEFTPSIPNYLWPWWAVPPVYPLQPWTLTSVSDSADNVAGTLLTVGVPQ